MTPELTRAQEGFTRFVETCLNRLRRKPQPPQASAEESPLSTETHSPSEICLAMASAPGGVGQFSRDRQSPLAVFMAFEAVEWMLARVTDIETRDQGRKEGLGRHALAGDHARGLVVEHVSVCFRY